MAEPMRRMTRQRQAVVRVLEDQDVFRSAQDVHAELAARGDSVGLATVYRNLQALVQSGSVDSVRSVDGEVLYRLCEKPGHHHHLVCAKCGRTKEFSLENLETELSAVARAQGYRLTDHELELFGICSSCDESPA